VVAEPHTVSFVLDNKTATDIVSPFAVPNSTQFTVIPPGSNSEPLKVPGKNNVIIAVNARSYVPTVIDLQGNIKHLPPSTAAYAMMGNERYVNSGWLLPKRSRKSISWLFKDLYCDFPKSRYISLLVSVTSMDDWFSCRKINDNRVGDNTILFFVLISILGY
jgi:hypothetical protein